jgi:hypothetical protein
MKPGTVPHVFAMFYNGASTGVERSKVLASLRAEGLPVGSGYVRLMHENPVFQRKVAFGKEGCPWSCHLYATERNYRNLSFPEAEKMKIESFVWFYHIHRPNTVEDMKDVVAAFQKVFGNMETLRKTEIKGEIGYKW